jgi:hypothetical protein
MCALGRMTALVVDDGSLAPTVQPTCDINDGPLSLDDVSHILSLLHDIHWPSMFTGTCLQLSNQQSNVMMMGCGHVTNSHLSMHMLQDVTWHVPHDVVGQMLIIVNCQGNGLHTRYTRLRSKVQ